MGILTKATKRSSTKASEPEKNYQPANYQPISPETNLWIAQAWKEGLSTAAIAEKLEMSESAVRSIVFRLRKQGIELARRVGGRRRQRKPLLP